MGEMIPCPVCGKMFPPFARYDGHLTGVYCCINCAISALAERREYERAEEKSNTSKPPTAKKKGTKPKPKKDKAKKEQKPKVIRRACAECGKTFQIEGSDHGYKYCSWQCRHAAALARERERKAKAKK